MVFAKLDFFNCEIICDGWAECMILTFACAKTDMLHNMLVKLCTYRSDELTISKFKWFAHCRRCKMWSYMMSNLIIAWSVFVCIKDFITKNLWIICVDFNLFDQRRFSLEILCKLLQILAVKSITMNISNKFWRTNAFGPEIWLRRFHI